MLPFNGSENMRTSKTCLHAERDISKLYILQSSDSVVSKYVMSVVAAFIAELVTYPLDLTKTRLQLQGELMCSSNPSYRGLCRTALGIIQEEGVFCLWRGVLPALYRHVIYTGIRMSTYEQLRESFEREDGLDGFPLWKKVLAGMAAGGFGQLIASPTDLVKTQIQMEGRRRLQGLAPRVHGSLHATKQILAAAGLFGLWRGCWPNVQRAALVNLGDLSTYDSVKRAILNRTKLKDNPMTHGLSSAAAGFVGAILGTPADVVKARIMNQATDPSGKGIIYKSSFDCFSKTLKSEGLSGLYKGFVPCWLRMAPWSLTFWLSFEKIRYLYGTKSW